MKSMQPMGNNCECVFWLHGWVDYRQISRSSSWIQMNSSFDCSNSHMTKNKNFQLILSLMIEKTIE